MPNRISLNVDFQNIFIAYLSQTGHLWTIRNTAMIFTEIHLTVKSTWNWSSMYRHYAKIHWLKFNCNQFQHNEAIS